MPFHPSHAPESLFRQNTRCQYSAHFPNPIIATIAGTSRSYSARPFLFSPLFIFFPNRATSQGIWANYDSCENVCLGTQIPPRQTLARSDITKPERRKKKKLNENIPTKPRWKGISESSTSGRPPANPPNFVHACVFVFCCLFYSQFLDIFLVRSLSKTTFRTPGLVLWFSTWLPQSCSTSCSPSTKTQFRPG